MDQNIRDRINEISLLAYFNSLAARGIVKYERQSGNNHYYRDSANRYAVRDRDFYNFMEGRGGGIIQAIQMLENKTYKEAVDRVKEMTGLAFNDTAAKYFNRIAVRPKYKEPSSNFVYFVTEPNNEKLLNYFKLRGIDEDVVKATAKQIHYRLGNNKYFGIGMQTESGGYALRNEWLNIKIGMSDISIRRGAKDNKMVVFEGVADLLSFVQLQKNKGIPSSQNLVSLNSVTNTQKFIDRFSHYDGKVFLCLDGDEAGNKATRKIMNSLPNAIVQDIRSGFGISEHQHTDLNNFLVSQLPQQKNAILAKNEIYDRLDAEYYAAFGNDESRDTGENYQRDNQASESRKTDNGERPSMDGHNAGNGLATSTGDSERTGGIHPSALGEQHSDDGESKDRKLDDGGLRLINHGTGISAINELLTSDRKFNNDDIESIVAEATAINDSQQVVINPNLTITPELQQALQEFKSGGTQKKGRGILDEYYTDTKLVDAVRNIISQHIPAGKQLSVLEPSVGTGNFLNLLKELPNQKTVNSFEINKITAGITKILYPDANVNLRSFETEFITDIGEKKSPAKEYDLIIGNPPYGAHRGFYKGLGEEPNISRFEDYFVKRSLDVLKDDGLLAMILPSSWIERQKEIKAETVAAYRLPSGVFAGTAVGTDIVVLKKSQQKNDLSHYFENHPLQVLGEIKERTNRFGRTELYVHGSLSDALILLENHRASKSGERIGNLFESAWEQSKIDKALSAENATEKKEQAEKSEEVTERKERYNLQPVRDAIYLLENLKFKNSITKMQLSEFQLGLQTFDIFGYEQKLEFIESAKDFLKDFEKKRGSNYEVQFQPHIKKGIYKYLYLKDDQILPAARHNIEQLSSKEIEAFRNTEYNGMLKDPEQFREQSSYFNGAYINNFYYLEGDIYEKLEILENDFNRGDISKDSYDRQKKMLLSVLPEPKSIEDIVIAPNHELVHSFIVGKSDREYWNYETRQVEVHKDVETSLAQSFKDFLKNLPRSAFGSSALYEVIDYVDNISVTGSDKNRNALVRERRKEIGNELFSKFLREDLPKEKLNKFVDAFNRQYNNIHIPDYSKFPLFSDIYENFKGKPLDLSVVQKAGIGRLTTKGVGLLAHEVGFGKTLSGILAMHEAMHRGNAKRPLIVVPNNNILKQWAETIFETIPNAKVNILGNLGKDYDLSKFENLDGEITLVTYEGFNQIGFKKEITESFANRFSYISESETRGIKNCERDVMKDMEKTAETEGRMRRGKVYDWEDFGFDHLTFDEVHNANHIIGKVRIEDRRFASDFRNQNQQTSQLGINTWMAAQYIQDRYDGRNVTLLSATPFTNKPLEYYSILSLIANDRLDKAGFMNVNTFFETFMEADTEMEIDAKGDIKNKTNVRRFKNNALFQQLLAEFVDIKGEEDNPDLKRPNRINKEYKIPQNSLTDLEYLNLNNSFSDNEKGAILTHILSARQIAISPYLSPFYAGKEPTVREFIDNSPKLKMVMDLIAQNKKDEPNAGQIIYSEICVDAFPKMKEYLIQNVGFEPKEVEIISGATSKVQREKIQENFNAGNIKVIIGSQAIQEGMNLQAKTSDMYLLSLPYNFTALRQTEGRAWRQGNQWENVRINYMLMNDSIDIFMLEKLKTKQARWLEAMKSGASVLDVSDINAAELKTSIITDQNLRAKIEIEIMQKRLEAEKERISADSAFIMRKHDGYVKAREAVQDAKDKLQSVTNVGTGRYGNKNTYWEKMIPLYQERLEHAIEMVKFTEEKMIKEGVDLPGIMAQIAENDRKIKEIEDRIAGLPNIKEKLVEKFALERLEREKGLTSDTFLSERRLENESFYSIAEMPKAATLEENQSRGLRR